MLWPALFASFFLSMTFSWDEFVISFLLTRFDTTLPVEIWNLLRSGLNPRDQRGRHRWSSASRSCSLVLLELAVLRRSRA